ncbi:YqgE/AlgH family protein, partial [Escherichia coli]|uniref:YqgE/AlgH family protein n=1 Tax=Escherichia coli TaxID=562 RepID=UPI00256EFAC9
SHPSASQFGDVRDQMGLDASAADDRRLLVGGPGEPTRGFVVHSLDWGGEGTIDVAGHFAVSGSLDVPRALAAGRGPTHWQLAMGYAGWS